MPRAYIFLGAIVIVGLGFVPAVACRSTPDVPEPTEQAPAEPTHSAKKEPIDLVPVGLGGGPQDESSPSTAETPTPTPKPATPKPKPATPKPKPSTTPTLPLPPWPTTFPSSWWPFPSPSATQGPSPPTPGSADAGKDWAAPTE